MSNSDQFVQAQTDRAQLTHQSLKSGLITFAAQPMKLAIGIGTTAALARLVTPADFGLLAMVSPLLVLVDSLSNFGLETATIQRQSLTHKQASAAFWLSLTVNAVIITAMVGMGPVLAQFYSQPALVAITAAMAVGEFSTCLSFQHKALLKRRMQFKLLAGIELIAIVISTTTALTAAWMGLGYWALVLQVVAMQVVQNVAYWITCDWRPDSPTLQKAKNRASNAKRSEDDIKGMFAYGINLTGFRFITRIGMQMDRILVGYISGATALGFYDVAYRWAYFPFLQIYAPLFDVAVSSLSRAYENPQTYRKYAKWTLTALFALCLPALTFLYVTAQDILLALLGEQWLSAVPIFRLLLVATAINSAYRVTKWLYLSSGQTRRQLYWGLVHAPVAIAAVSIGAHWGAYGIAAGYTLSTCILTYPSILFCLKDSPLKVSDFLSTFWPPAATSLLAGILLFAVTPLFAASFNNSLLTLCFQAVFFTTIYCAMWLSLPNSRKSAIQAIAQLRQLRQKQ